MVIALLGIRLVRNLILEMLRNVQLTAFRHLVQSLNNFLTYMHGAYVEGIHFSLHPQTDKKLVEPNSYTTVERHGVLYNFALFFQPLILGRDYWWRAFGEKKEKR